MSALEMQSNDYLTPREVASILRISLDSVYRMRVDVPGVLVLGNMRRKRRPYRTLRIPIRGQWIEPYPSFWFPGTCVWFFYVAFSQHELDRSSFFSCVICACI
jgi:hypothetical protein